MTRSWAGAPGPVTAIKSECRRRSHPPRLLVPAWRLGRSERREGADQAAAGVNNVTPMPPAAPYSPIEFCPMGAENRTANCPDALLAT